MRFVQLSAIITLVFLIQPAPSFTQDLKFSDISRAAGIASPLDTTGYGHGASVADFNNDGYPDIYPAMYEIYNPLYLNNHDGTFSNQASAWTVGGKKAWLDRGIAAADYNNDGNIDILLNNAWEPSALFRNDGSSFTDVATDLWINFRGQAQGVLWFDMNNDGLLDLFFPSYSSESELYVQRSDGKFENRTGAAWLGNTKYAISAIAVDVNNDGFLDMFVTRGEGYSNLLLINRNGSTFSDEAAKRGISDTSAHAQGLTAGDFDNDGDIDIYVANATGTNMLYRNNGSGYFRDEAWNLGVGDWHRSLGAHFADFDNDGWLDLYVVNFGSNRLYHNQGDGSFREANSSGAGGQSFWASYGSAVADFDQDGDLDIFFTNSGQESTLFDNQTEAGNWIDIALEGSRSNRDGIGAKVDFWANGRIHHNQMRASDGFVSGAILPMHFGLGSGTYADSIIVRWPSGTVTKLFTVDSNQKILVKEEGTTTYRRFEINFSEAQDSGLDSFALTGDIAVIDIDRDERPDIFATGNRGSEFFLLRNEGTGRFVRSDSSFGLTAPRSSGVTSFLFIDFDADGDSDLLTAETQSGQAQLALYRFDAGKFFRDTDVLLPQIEADSVHFMFFGQIDPDGIDDLFLIAGAQRRALIFLGNRQGGFTQSQSSAFLPEGIGNSRLVDFDRDGDVDLFLERNGVVELYDNRSGEFSRIFPAGLPAGSALKSFEIADMNSDGLPDLLISQTSSPAYAIYTYDGSSFGKTWEQEAAAEVPVSDIAAALVLDLENDGDLDMMLPSAQNKLHANQGDGTFRPIDNSRSGLPADLPGARHTLTLDSNGDGLTDVLFISMEGSASLFRNAFSDARNWLNVRVAGHNGRMPAAGAVVRLLAEDGQPVALRMLDAGNSNGRQQSSLLHFGLGDRDRADLVIDFPGGQSRSFTAVPSRQLFDAALDRPVVTIISPQDQSTVYGDSIRVHGAVWDATISTVSINGVGVPVLGGEFSHVLAVTAGMTSLTVSATDSQGRESRASIEVVVVEDRTPPAPADILLMPVLPRVVMQVSTDEPVRLLLEYGSKQRATQKFYATTSIVLDDLESDSIYSARLTLTDRAGNTTIQELKRFMPYPAQFRLSLPAGAFAPQSGHSIAGQAGTELPPGDSLTAAVSIPEDDTYFVLLDSESRLNTQVLLKIGDSERMLPVGKDDLSPRLARFTLPAGEYELILKNAASDSSGPDVLNIREVTILGPDAGDILPPLLVNLNTEVLSPTSLRLRWQTDEPAAGSVIYRLLGGADSLQTDFGFAAEQDIVLENLWPDSTYLYTISMRDSAGNNEVYAGNSFFIAVKSDSVPPELSGIFALQTGKRSFRFRWKTDEPSRSWVEINGAGSALRSDISTRYSRLHEHTITAPEAEGNYTVRLLARDYGGNTAAADTSLLLPDGNFIAFFEAGTVQERTGGTIAENGGWLAHSAGYLGQPISLPDSGNYRLRFAARSLATGASPQVTLSAGGDSLATFAVAGDSLQNFAATVSLPAGDSDLRLAWQDVNPADSSAFLQIDWLDVNKLPMTTGVVDGQQLAVPTNFQVSAAYPNPFNPSTAIKISAPETAKIRVLIFNITGQIIFSRELGRVNAGEYVFRWNGRDDKNRVAGSGVYYARIEIQSAKGMEFFVRKLSLLK